MRQLVGCCRHGFLCRQLDSCRPKTLVGSESGNMSSSTTCRRHYQLRAERDWRSLQRRNPLTLPPRTTNPSGSIDSMEPNPSTDDPWWTNSTTIIMLLADFSYLIFVFAFQEPPSLPSTAREPQERDRGEHPNSMLSKLRFR